MNSPFQKFLAVCLAILAGGIASAQNSNAARVPEEAFPQLAEILREALNRSPRMVINQLSLEAADGGVMQAKSGLYPSIGGYYQRTETKDKREDLPGQTIDSSKTYYSVTLTQPIFHWGERVNNAKIGEIRGKMADKQYEEAYRLLAREIRVAYLDLIAYKVQLQNVNFDKARADEALKSGEERAAKKLISEGDVYNLRIAASQAALNQATLESNFETAKQQFEILTGLPAPADTLIPDGIPVQKSTDDDYSVMLQQFLGEAEPATPALISMRNQIDIDVLTYKNQRKRLLPKLNFLLGVSQDDQSYTINNGLRYGLQSTFAGLQVTWQLFDGFATRGAVRSALAQRRQSEASYRNELIKQRVQAGAACRAIDLARQQMRISDRILENSSTYLDFRQEDFKRGKASEADVKQAQAGYYSSMVSATNSRINFLMKQADFLSAIAQDPAMQNLSNN